VLILAGVNIAVSLASGVFGGVVAALQRFDLCNGVELIGTALRSVAVVLVLTYGQGLVALAIVNLIFGILTGLAYFIVALRLYPPLKIHFGGCDKRTVNLIFSFSVYSFLLNASAYVIFYTDSVVISAFLPVSAVTFFVIASNLLGYGKSLLTGISTISTPLASLLDANGDRENLRRVLLSGSRLASAVFLPVGITLLIRGHSFVGLWMAPSYAALSGQVLAILSIAQLIASGNCVPASMTFGIGKHRGVVPAVVVEAVCNLVLSIVLVRHYGIVGVALGTAVPNLVTHLFFWPWYIGRCYGIRPMRYAVSTWVRPGIAALPFVFCTYAVQEWWHADSLLMFILQVALVLPVALVSFWFLCMAPEERIAYSRRFLETMPMHGLVRRASNSCTSPVEP
jgi:O-antigen/teichoic acid export membrane protein